jgi:septation ring formation regulator EzrA
MLGERQKGFAMAGVDEVIRQWVQKVEQTGELRNVPGFGEPFEFNDGFLETPAELRMAYKILKDAGYVPAEVEMVQRLAELREQLNATHGKAEQRALEIKVAELQQKVTMMLEAMRGKR